jgi:PAS domain S-box-containing protein
MLQKDPRLGKIKQRIERFSLGDFGASNGSVTEGDDVDGILKSLDNLGKTLSTSGKEVRDYERRVNRLMEVLLKYTVMDFSEKAEVSNIGDELDAVSVGLNTLAEELQASHQELEERVKERTKELVEVNKNLQNEIRERKKVEASLLKTTEFLEIIQRIAHVGSWEWDMVSNKIIWSDELYRIYGLKPQEMLASYENFLEFIHPDDREYTNSVVQKAILDHQPFDFHHRVIRKDNGEVRIINGRGTVTLDENNMAVHMYGSSQDVTEQKKSEEEIKRLNADLEDKVNEIELVNKELEAFTYSVSHDLRTPLRAISGYTKIIEEEYISKLDEEALTMMTAVVNNAKKMGQLIDDLLKFSRLGRKALEKKQVDMTTLANLAVDEVKKSYEDINTEITIHPLGNAMADQSLVLQALTNLVSNAIKFSSKKEKPKVEIGVKEVEGEISYFVKDNGAGFDMKYYDKLFGVFQRLHDATEFEGNGVGLALVKRIITKHEGRVWAEAKVNEGATFYFTLGKPQKKQVS